MRRFVGLIILVATGWITCAAEFWLEPKKFRYTVGEDIRIDFMRGENFVGEFWDLKKNKADLAQWYSTAGIRDLRLEIKPTRGNNVILKSLQEGTQLVVLKSNETAREWSGEEFTRLLKENGLDEIADARTNSGTESQPANDASTYFAKVLMQVGDKKDETWKRKAGLPLEIIPDQNPYSLNTGDYLQCLVLFNNKPLPHTLVHVWTRLNRTTFVQNIYTENDGTIKFPISTRGTWMVTTVTMIPQAKPGSGWKSFWGSLTFGI